MDYVLTMSIQLSDPPRLTSQWAGAQISFPEGTAGLGQGTLQLMLFRQKLGVKRVLDLSKKLFK